MERADYGANRLPAMIGLVINHKQSESESESQTYHWSILKRVGLILESISHALYR